MTVVSPKPLLVIAIGNPSRGDDAIGPALLDRLERWLAESPEGAPLQDQMELVEDFQLHLEHVVDMHGRKAVLIIDAAVNQAEPYRLFRATAQPNHSITSHALSPEALLSIWPSVYADQTPPPVHILAVKGEAFELGAGMSERAMRHVEQAWAAMAELFLGNYRHLTSSVSAHF